MPIQTEILDENKMILTIEGSKGNSFGVETLQDLLDQLDKASLDDTIAGIVITGSGRTFSVGGDVFAMYEAMKQGDVHRYFDAVVPLIEQVVIKVLEHRKPVIAAVNGAAAGGGMSLALACDEIVCLHGAKFGMAFGGLALSPDSGSSILYAEHFGRREAIHGISTAKVYTADSLHELGILDIVEPDNLISTACERIDTKVSTSSYSYAKTKILVNQPILRQLKLNLPLEAEMIKEASKREEFEEKVNATVDRLSK